MLIFQLFSLSTSVADDSNKTPFTLEKFYHYIKDSKDVESVLKKLSLSSRSYERSFLNNPVIAFKPRGLQKGLRVIMSSPEDDGRFLITFNQGQPFEGQNSFEVREFDGKNYRFSRFTFPVKNMPEINDERCLRCHKDGDVFEPYNHWPGFFVSVSGDEFFKNFETILKDPAKKKEMQELNTEYAEFIHFYETKKTHPRFKFLTIDSKFSSSTLRLNSRITQIKSMSNAYKSTSNPKLKPFRFLTMASLLCEDSLTTPSLKTRTDFWQKVNKKDYIIPLDFFYIKEFIPAHLKPQLEKTWNAVAKDTYLKQKESHRKLIDFDRNKIGVKKRKMYIQAIHGQIDFKAINLRIVLESFGISIDDWFPQTKNPYYSFGDGTFDDSPVSFQNILLESLSEDEKP